MILKCIKEIIIVTIFVLIASIIIATPLGFLFDAGFATEAAKQICSEDNMELSQIWGIQTNRCWVRACDNKFDGIEFCEVRQFMVQDGYFNGGTYTSGGK